MRNTFTILNSLLAILYSIAPVSARQGDGRTIEVLLIGGRVMDGAGNHWVRADVGISSDRIVFVGSATGSRIQARDTVDVTDMLVTPGFWDMHSHAEFETQHGRHALPFIYQGITTVVLGVDGGGGNTIDEIFDGYSTAGIAVNALRYVGHGAARRAVMGVADREPSPGELDALKAYVRSGMEEGAIGLSTGLFYIPGYFAKTDEVVALNAVAAEYGGVYDTHDRDLGAAYQGIGYDASVAEAIEIGERTGTPVIFSHFNPQGAHNYGRANVGAQLIDEARSRGVNVMAAQHVYTATQSSLRAYAIPRWAADGGRDAMLSRFQDPSTIRRLDAETMEMLALRGGPEKILFADQRQELNGRTLAEVASGWELPVPESVRRIITERNASVMNLDLYDIENTRYLAQMEWMMTCTDGRTPPPGGGIVHPRPYGAFTRKLRLFVREEGLISLPFAVRGMTSLGATFLGIPERGLIKEGFYADIAVFDEPRIADRATFENPHQYSEGTVHVMVNGEFAFRDGEPTGVLGGRPIRRDGRGSEARD